MEKIKIKPTDQKSIAVTLIREGRKEFKAWGIPMDEYIGEIQFNPVTCLITYIRRGTGATLVLRDVFYNKYTGQILQCKMSFR